MKKSIFHKIEQDGLWIFCNCIINHIPCWSIRKWLYRAVGMKIAQGARIGLGTIVSKPRYISIGKRSIINQCCHLDGRGHLTIENDVTISAYSIIVTEAHIPDSGTFDTKREPVIIKERAWLGMRAMVLNGSIVEKNAIIGAGCVFKGHCEENDIMVGNPAKCIKKRYLQAQYKKTYRAFFI